MNAIILVAGLIVFIGVLAFGNLLAYLFGWDD